MRTVVTGINKTTDSVTLTYDPWCSAYLDDAVGELECQGRRVVADREGVGADNGGGDGGEVVGEPYISSKPPRTQLRNSEVLTVTRPK